MTGHNPGRRPVGDVPHEDLAEVLRNGSYRAAGDFAALSDADIAVLCVPTPYHGDAPDLSYVGSAVGKAPKHLTDGSLAMLESTAYPEEVVLPALESGFGSR